MLDYMSILTFLFLFCILCIVILVYTTNYDPKTSKIRRLGRKFKVVTGPQFSEICLTEKEKKELQLLVDDATAEVHEFIANANYFYFVIKHVFGKNPQPFIFCSINGKKVITSEMTHTASINKDFLEVPLDFNQLYRFLSRL